MRAAGLRVLTGRAQLRGGLRWVVSWICPLPEKDVLGPYRRGKARRSPLARRLRADIQGTRLSLSRACTQRCHYRIGSRIGLKNAWPCFRIVGTQSLGVASFEGTRKPPGPGTDAAFALSSDEVARSSGLGFPNPPYAMQAAITLGTRPTRCILFQRPPIEIVGLAYRNYGSSGQFVGGCEPVRAWVPVDLWITSLLPTGPTGQAGDLWTTSLLPTDPQPYRKCDDRTARGAGRFGLGEHPAPISGKMAVCTNHRYPEGGDRDAAQDYPQSCPENQIVRVWCGSLGGGRPLPDSGSGTASSGQWPAGVFGLWADGRGTTGCQPGASSSSRFGG